MHRLTPFVFLALTLAPDARAVAQTTDRPRVLISASIGAGGIQGAQNVAPGGRTRVVAGGLTVRLTQRFSADLEIAFTDLVEGDPWARRSDWQLRQNVRDRVTSAYGRAHVLRRTGVSLEALAGLALVSSASEEYSRGYNPLSQTWSAWVRRDPDQSSATGTTHHWMLAVGGDLAIGGERIAVVPAFRVRVPFGSSGPVVGDVMRFAVGARVGF